MRKNTKIRPLVEVNAVWEREDGIYPDAVRIAMEDGQVVTYRIDMKLPHPCTVKSREIMARWAEQDKGVTVVGYKARHEQKESRREKLMRFMGMKKAVSW